jgi:2-C-methyl-D-erythritol 4-phosphate cytidylyltransferase
MNKPLVYAIIVAGGSGVRMGASVPKQFLLLNHKTILQHSVDVFIQAIPTIQIIVVLPEAYLQEGKNIFTNYTNIAFTAGGATRFNSVQNGLQLVTENGIVFVHDAVRCLVTPQLIQNCLHQALEKGSAIPAVVSTDSVRFANNENENSVLDRSKVFIIQTPQTFTTNTIKPAFQQPYNTLFTDEANVVEANGQKVFLIEGEYTNIKITRPIDLVIAEHILQERSANG